MQGLQFECDESICMTLKKLYDREKGPKMFNT